jgi:hypothetical protein
MDQQISDSVSVLGNFLLIGGLVYYGFSLFAEYHSSGKWAKNITGLLAGLGMLTLALALVMTPSNAEVIRRIAMTKASTFFLVVSSVLMLAAIAAFGLITYAKPFRLRHQRRIQRDRHRELPKIP